MSDRYTTVVVCDFEYEITDGDLPNVLCMVAYVLDGNLQHVRTIRLWRGDFRKEPPFDIGPDALFVAYSAWAELTCFMTLGWKFPQHVFDLHTAYLAKSNILLPYEPNEKRKKQRKRLPDACRAYGIEGWERADKDSIAKDIGEGNWHKYGREGAFSYCAEDVRMSTLLLREQLRDPAVSVEHVLLWSEYAASTVALIQARGMPIDMQLWNLVQENKQPVIKALLQRFDPSHGDGDPIYTPDGQWSYVRFEQWLARNGVTAWPRTETGRLDVKGDSFRLMYHVPGIEGLHALRDSLRVVATAKLPIGRDGRNRPSLFPFGTATGRNAHGKSLYNSHAGMRSFMRFPDDKIGVYLDWKAQEVGVVAALSGDQALMAAYSGDVYHALALVCGLTDDPDPNRWKKNNQMMRQRMKALQLGINYGMGVPSLARGLDQHPLIASAFIERHQRAYPRFWQWRNDQVEAAMLERRIESVFGWPLRITTSPNQRTLYNFLGQGNAAEMLRHAAVRLCRAGLIPCMLVHDGILFELDTEEQIAHAKEIMRAVARDVCNGFEIGVDEDQKLINGVRYQDKREVAKEMWGTIIGTLREIGALS